MGVYVFDMEMPANCYICPFCDYVSARCDAVKGNPYTPEVRYERRADWCPLVNVPPHGRLIDADALMKVCGMANDCYHCPNGERGWCKRSQDAANICESIEDAPTIIPAEEGET